MRMPVSWHTHEFRKYYHYGFPIVFAGNGELVEPCVNKIKSLDCGFAWRTISSPGIVVSVYKDIGPRTPSDSIHQIGGKSVRVAGHPAKIREEPGVCNGHKDYRGLMVTMAATTRDWYVFETCIRGPHIATTEGQFWAAVNSVSIEGFAN